MALTIPSAHCVRELEEAVREKDKELATTKQQLSKLSTDFNYNLKVRHPHGFYM